MAVTGQPRRDGATTGWCHAGGDKGDAPQGQEATHRPTSVPEALFVQVVLGSCCPVLVRTGQSNGPTSDLLQMAAGWRFKFDRSEEGNKFKLDERQLPN